MMERASARVLSHRNFTNHYPPYLLRSVCCYINLRSTIGPILFQPDLQQRLRGPAIDSFVYAFIPTMESESSLGRIKIVPKRVCAFFEVTSETSDVRFVLEIWVWCARFPAFSFLIRDVTHLCLCDWEIYESNAICCIALHGRNRGWNAWGCVMFS